MIFHSRMMDLWIPGPNVGTHGEVSTSTYTLAQSGMLCDLVRMSSKDKLIAGLDLTVQMGTVYVDGKSITVTGGIPLRSLLKDSVSGVVWRVEDYPTHYDRVIDHYEMLVCQLLSPPAEVVA